MPHARLFQRLSIGRKALLLFTIPAVAQLAFVAGVLLLERARERTQEAAAELRSARRTANDLAGKVFDLQLMFRDVLTTRDPARLDAVHALHQQTVAMLPAVNALDSAESRRLAEAADAVLAVQSRGRTAIASGDFDAATSRLTRDVLLPMKRYRAAHVAFVAAVERREASNAARSSEADDRFRGFLVAGAAANLGLLGFAASAIAVDVKRRLATIVDNTRRLARGEAVARPLPTGDEISEVDAAFHQMAGTLSTRSAELQAAHAEMEAFAYSVSHDLRAPLRAVGGYARMLEEDHGDQLDGGARRYLDTIRNEAVRMGQLIDDLLRFARLSRQRLSLQPVDVGAMAERCMEELRAAEPGRRIEFSVEELPSAAADPSLLRVVLINLLSNAVKYSAPRDVSRIALSGRVEGDACVYTLRDNGVGFDMRYASKLFGVFQRLHTNEQFEGTGVGLALVERVIVKHGGTIRAESTPGDGASFTFTLPASPELHDAA